MSIVAEKNAQLLQIEANLDELNRLLAQKKEKFDNLQTEHLHCTQKLHRASDIITGLGGEKSRWQETVEGLGVQYITLTGDILVASGVLAYLGVFTTEFRSDQIVKWTERCNSLGIHCAK